MGFATAVREGRVAKGLSQDQLAAALGLSQPSVSAWERGAKIPSVPVFRRLIQILDLDAAEVLALVDESKEDSVA